eukprot:7774918-Prorocentrum_lima.AAC.1
MELLRCMQDMDCLSDDEEDEVKKLSDKGGREELSQAALQPLLKVLRGKLSQRAEATASGAEPPTKRRRTKVGSSAGAGP